MTFTKIAAQTIGMTMILPSVKSFQASAKKSFLMMKLMKRNGQASYWMTKALMLTRL
jgi:hypothetical protein